MVTIPSTNPQCSHPSLDQKTIEAAKYLAANGVAINPNAFPEEIIQAAHSISIQIAQAANAVVFQSRRARRQHYARNFASQRSERRMALYGAPSSVNQRNVA